MEKYRFLRIELSKKLKNYLLNNEKSQNLTKQDISCLNYQLLKVCRAFSTSDFEKNNIYTAPFFYDVIVPTFPNSKKDFSITFLDFNNLGKANEKYGYEMGDYLLENSLTAIEDLIPRDSIFVRKGGDEFVIISEKLSKDELAILVQNLNEQLKLLNKEKITFTATFSYRSASDYDSKEFNEEPNEYSKFFEMLSECEGEVTLKKFNRNFSSNIKPEEILRNKIQLSVSKIFSISRFDSSTKFDLKHLEIYLDNLTGSIYRLISTKKVIQNEEKQLFKKSAFSFKDATDLFSIIKADSSENGGFLKKLQNFNPDRLKELINILTTNINSNLHNRLYSETLLMPYINNSKDTYTISTFLLSGLKSSNFVNGYNLTDKYLEQISGKLENLLEFNSSKALDLKNADLHLLDYGGGQYIYIKKENNKEPQNLKEIASKLDEFSNSLDSNFNVVFASKTISGDSKNFNATIASLLKESEKKKSKLKLQNLEKNLNSESQKIFFDSIISDSISYYLDSNNGFVKKDKDGNIILNMDNVKSNLLNPFLEITKLELEKFEHFRKKSKRDNEENTVDVKKEIYENVSEQNDGGIKYDDIEDDFYDI